MADTAREKWYHRYKKQWIPILGMAVGVFLLAGGSFLSGESGKEAASTSVAYYTETLEERIQKLCTSVNGVTEAAVLLTLENGSEYVYAQDSTGEGQVWDYVIVSRGDTEEAVLVTEIYPQVRGVAVVCTGGDSPAVQQTIIRLLSASLGLSSNRIHVAGN